jgi:hypothetical protein
MSVTYFCTASVFTPIHYQKPQTHRAFLKM